MYEYIKHGYKYILVKNHPFASKDGCVMEHRLVMEEHIGRYLTADEVVHHKNSNSLDNRIENLELIENHSKHMKLHHENKDYYLDGLKDYIIERYNDGIGSHIIAKEVKRSKRAVLRWMVKQGIERRKPDQRVKCKEGYKWCNVCEQEFPKSEFYINKNSSDGLRNRCKSCTKKETSDAFKKNWSIRHNMEYVPTRQKIECKEGYKSCNVCKQELLKSEFYTDKNTKDGYKNRCKSCAKKEAKQAYKNNKER